MFHNQKISKDCEMFTTQSHDQEFLQCPLPPRPTVIERRWKPNVEIAPNCPRCNSSNTKFCYYNNYSLTQPRYFCKSCRRYWTKGGSLRNVPIGGGCRKNRRSRSVPVSTNRGATGTSSYGSEQSGIGRSKLHQDDPNGDSSYGNGSDGRDAQGSGSSNIDLALVYAKFLNQQPDSSPDLMPADCPRDFDSTFDLLSVSDTTPNTHAQFSLEQCIDGSNVPSDPSPETNLSDGPDQMFSGEYELNYEEPQRISVSQSTDMELSSYGLQPLAPSDNLVVQDMYWSNSPIGGANFSWHATNLEGFHSVNVTDDHSLHSNSLDDNWSSFDLSNFDAFTRP